MPEPYRLKKKGSFRLADAERSAFGNIECDDVVYRQRWRCRGCNGAAQMQIKVEDPPASGGFIIRRLERVDYVPRPVWRDESG